MYYEERMITIFSERLDLEHIVRFILSSEPTAFQVHTAEHFTDEWKQSDIVICDIPVEELTPYRHMMKQSAYLFYISNVDSDMCQDAHHAADELLYRPVNECYMQKRVRKVCEQINTDEELWLTSTYLDVLIDTMPDLAWIKNNEGIHVKVNEMFCHTVGKDRKDVIGKDHCAVWDVETNDCEETEKIVRQQKRTCQFIELVQSRDGMRQFRTYKSPLLDRKGEIIGTVGIGHDVTDLENLSTEMEIVLNSMPFAILLKDQHDIILNINEKFEEYFQVKKAEVVGKTYYTWYGTLLQEYKSMEKEDGTEMYLTQDGTIRVLETDCESVHDIFMNNVGELYIYRDTTKEYFMNQQLSNNSNTDFLTGLCNRRYFYECFPEHHHYPQVSILYVDLDYFKKVNDTYGHQIGDDALILVAKVLLQCFPEDLITRLGGDEFLVSKTYEISEADLVQQANHFIVSLKQAFKCNECFHILSASVGISYTKDSAKQIDTLIKESDIALYHAKQTGKAKCCVYCQEY